jgi:hypothetical protein
MVLPLRAVLVGRPRSHIQWGLDVLLVLSLLVGTFAAYALGLVHVSGGVIILPGAATLIGFIVAVCLGIGHRGLLVACASLFATYIGFQAEWAFLGLSSHSLTGKLAFLFDPVGLAVFGVAALIIGTVGFGVGFLARMSFERLGWRPGPSLRSDD